MPNTVKKIFFVIIFAIFISILFLTYHFHILQKCKSITVSESNAHVYCINDNYTLLVWHDKLYMIMFVSRRVGKISDYRNKLNGILFFPNSQYLLFWPKGSYDSIDLEDRVKGNSSDYYTFKENKIHIFTSNTQSKGFEIDIVFLDTKYIK